MALFTGICQKLKRISKTTSVPKLTVRHALLMARHLGTELNACPCYWPRKKGKIERPFNYIEEQFIKGNHFASMEDLNRRGKDFVESWCNETHTTTKRIPNIHYLQEERDLLLPLPDRRYRLKELESRIISPDCYISIGGNKYSVPDIFAAKTMYFRIIYGFRIEQKKELCHEIGSIT